VSTPWKGLAAALALVALLALAALLRDGGPAIRPPERIVAEEGAADGAPGADALPASEGEVLIGVIAPMTGGKADQGQQFREGVELAVADLNAEGGILGRSVDFLVLDDRGEPNEAAAAAQRLVATPRVVGVIGPSSTASSSAVAPILEKARMPTISPSASTRRLVTDNRCFYLMTLPMASYAPGVPETAVEVFGARDLAVIHVRDDWGRGVTELVDRWAGEAGVPVVGEASFTQGARFFKAQLTALFAARPDALVLNTHYVEGGLITRQARDLGYEGPIVAQGTVVYPPFLDLAGDAADGVVSWVSFLPTLPIPSVQRAVEKFRSAFGDPPQQYHVNAYDAVGVLAAAFERVGSFEEGAAVCEAVGRTRDYPGIVGPFSYDERRLPEKELFWVVAREGEWRLFELEASGRTGPSGRTTEEAGER